MSKQFELFSPPKKEENNKPRSEFRSIEDGHGVEIIENTQKIHNCFVCTGEIPIGSKVRKYTPIVDERPQWHESVYKHINPPCEAKEEQMSFPS